MFSSSLRAARPFLVRLAARQQPIRRTLFIPSAIRSADHVQDMYLRELKNYKTPPVKASDADGHVQKFALPKAPPSPEESNIANDLKAYEDQVVEVEGQAAAGEEVVEEDWFEDDESEEEESHGH